MKKDADDPLRALERLGETCEYQKSLAGINVVIDGTVNWNRSRYCNHSCAPNAKYFIWKVSNSSLEFVVVKAENTNKKGEEALVDYRCLNEPGSC